MPAMRRAARLGDGWLPQGPPKMGMRAAVDFIQSARAELYGPGEPFDLGINAEPIYVGTPDWDPGPFVLSGMAEPIAERLRTYAGLGANHIQVRFPARDVHELVDQIQRFGEEVWPLVESGMGGPAEI